MEKIRIGGIMQNAHLSLLNVTAVPDRPGIAASILNSLGKRSINVQFIIIFKCGIKVYVFWINSQLFDFIIRKPIV